MAGGVVVTSPTSVGEVSVEVLASASGFAKSLRDAVIKEFKGAGLDKAIAQSLAGRKFSISVTPEIDTDGITEKVKRTRAPKVPVTLDPLMAAFQADVKRQVTALARQAQTQIPVGADTTTLRKEIGAELAQIQQQLKAQIPTEPEGRREYEAKLQALVTAASSRVKANIKADVDVDVDQFRKSLGSLPTGGFRGVTDGIRGVASTAAEAAGSVAQLGGSLTGAATTATGPVGLIVGAALAAAAAIGAMAGAMVFAVPTVAALGGALGSLPAAITGVAAAFATLKLGFSGISEAFNEPVGGGGGGGGQSPEDRARQIAAAARGVDAARRGIAAANRGLASSERGLVTAQRGLVAAQREARAAQEALTAARAEARENIEDLARSLRSAHLSEKEAARDVELAAQELAGAQASTNPDLIRDAQLAYDRAVVSLEDAKDAAGDLGKESAKANKAGIEGSDAVQDALEQRRAATEGVIAANNSLLDAQDGLRAAQDGLKASYDGLKSAQDAYVQSQQQAAAGGGALGAQLTKLAPSAQKFVDQIKALKPAFEDLRLDVQQRLFAGLDETVKNLATAWMPQLRTSLGGMATMMNTFFKDLGTSLATPKFVTDIGTGLDAVTAAFSNIGKSISDSLVPAFGALSSAAAPFIREFGAQIAKVVTSFSEWILQGEKSGGLKSFFETATVSMRQLFDIGGSVASIIGSVFEIMFGGKKSDPKKSPIEGVRVALKKFADWLGKPENQQKVRDFIDAIKTAVATVGAVILKVAGWVNTVRGWAAKFGAFKNSVVGMFGTVKATVGQFITNVATAFSTLPGRVVGFIQGLPARVADIFTNLGRRVGQIVGFAVGSIAGFFSRLPGQIMGFIRSIPDRVAGIFNSVVAFARGLPGRIAAGLGGLKDVAGRIVGAFSGLGGRMLKVGKDVIRGLWDGIKSLGGWLKDQVVGFAGGVIDGFKRGFGSNSPAKKMIPVGVTLPQGLSVGLLKGERDLLKDVRGVASNVVGAAELPAVSARNNLPYDLAASAGAANLAMSSSLSVDPPQPLILGFDRSTTGDWLMDGIRRNVQIRFGGNVQTALGAGRATR